jgi:hypothetical protein
MLVISKTGPVAVQIVAGGNAGYLVLVNGFKVLKIAQLLFVTALALYQPGKNQQQYTKSYGKRSKAIILYAEKYRYKQRHESNPAALMNTG